MAALVIVAPSRQRFVGLVTEHFAQVGDRESISGKLCEVTGCRRESADGGGGLVAAESIEESGDKGQWRGARSGKLPESW